MRNKLTNLSNEELLKELKKNMEDNDLIFEEMLERKEKGELILPSDLKHKAS